MAKGDERPKPRGQHSLGSGKRGLSVRPLTMAERQNATRDKEHEDRVSAAFSALGVKNPDEANRIMEGDFAAKRLYLRTLNPPKN